LLISIICIIIIFFIVAEWFKVLRLCVF
jgi:t-SNARE complex subunit (syntaxin)